VGEGYLHICDGGQKFYAAVIGGTLTKLKVQDVMRGIREDDRWWLRDIPLAPRTVSSQIGSKVESKEFVIQDPTEDILKPAHVQAESSYEELCANALGISEHITRTEEAALQPRKPNDDPDRYLDELYMEFQLGTFPNSWKTTKTGFRKEWRGYTFLLILTQAAAWRYLILKGDDSWESQGVFNDDGYDMLTAFVKWCKLTELYPNAILGSWFKDKTTWLQDLSRKREETFGNPISN